MPPRRRFEWSVSAEQTLRALYAEGRTDKEIAAEIGDGVTVPQVKEQRVRLNLKKTRNNGQYTPPHIEARILQFTVLAEKNQPLFPARRA